jgi:hypothetical protein
MSVACRKRGGYALIEMVLAIGAVAIVVGLCAGMLHVLLRLDRAARSHVVETATIGRLARQLRHDVHAAREARTERAGNGPVTRLELVLPGDRTITYEMHERALLRREHQGNTVEWHETYTLPFCHEGAFVVQAQDGQDWVRLRLRRGPENEIAAGARSPRQDLAIDALAGRDLRRFPVSAEAKEETP